MIDRLQKTWSRRIRRGSFLWRLRSWPWRIGFVDRRIQKRYARSIRKQKPP